MPVMSGCYDRLQQRHNRLRVAFGKRIYMTIETAVNRATQCRINHVADVANATGLRPQGASGSREKNFSPSVVINLT